MEKNVKPAEKQEIKKVCQNCGKYNRCTKKCSTSGGYVARKHSCNGFTNK